MNETNYRLKYELQTLRNQMTGAAMKSNEDVLRNLHRLKVVKVFSYIKDQSFVLPFTFGDSNHRYEVRLKPSTYDPLYMSLSIIFDEPPSTKRLAIGRMRVLTFFFIHPTDELKNKLIPIKIWDQTLLSTKVITIPRLILMEVFKDFRDATGNFAFGVHCR